MAWIPATARCVDELPLADMCIGCGACHAICPHAAIRLVRGDTYRPVVRRDLCVRCGLCVAVCPRVDDTGYCGGSAVANEPRDGVGPVRTFYVGHSTDEALRFNGASGGMATAILVHAMQAGIVDGAVVTRMSDPESMECTSYIATSPEQLRGAQGSLYCPTAPLAALRAGCFEEFRALAFVGLPCHVLALRKMQAVSPALRERVVLAIGLFCGRGATLGGVRAALEMFCDGRKGVSEVGFRGRGWPGGLRVTYRDGTARAVPLGDYWPSLFAPYFFTPTGCLTCTDVAAESADISLGDAWLPEVRARDSVGTSVVVARTLQADGVIAQMVQRGRAELEQVSRSTVARSQQGVIRRKTLGVSARARVLHRLGRAVPAGMKAKALRRRHYVGAAAVLLNAWISGTSLGAWLIPRLPKGLLLRYGKFVQRFSR